MCSAIEFQGTRVRFSDPSPQLPILLKDGSVGWAQWGKPFSESLDRTAPAGGWARLDSIYAGRWKRFGVRPVLILASAYMESSPSGEGVWFPVADGLAIQGAAIRGVNTTLSADRGAEIVRVYVVTVDAVGEAAKVHDRMPRLVPRERKFVVP